MQNSKESSIELKNIEEEIPYDRSTNNTLYHLPEQKANKTKLQNLKINDKYQWKKQK